MLLAASLILNLVLLSWVSLLTEHWDGLHSDWRALYDNLNDMNNDMNEAVDRLEMEQRWITPIKIVLAERSEGEQKVRLSWRIKDYPEGAPVIFYYRKQGDSGDFIPLPAVSLGGGNFQVELAVELNTEPTWRVERYVGSASVKRRLSLKISEHCKTG